MKNIHLLVANTDRRTNNLIEAAVLDVCYDQAAVDCTRVSRLGELARQGAYSGNDLIVVAPHHLLAEPSRRGASVDIDEVVAVIQELKYRTAAPIFAVNVSPQAQLTLREGGVDVVLGVPLNIAEFKNEVRKVLDLSEAVEEEPEPVRRRWSLSTFFTF